MAPGQVAIETSPSMGSDNADKIIAAWTAYKKPDGTQTSEAMVYISAATIPGYDVTGTCTPWLMLLLK